MKAVTLPLLMDFGYPKMLQIIVDFFLDHNPVNGAIDVAVFCFPFHFMRF